nr:MAG TPA: hypothetical protein [Siphoviridae sp. ctcOR4]DAO91856.1 MAG TPA: hypothetical protein [Caudoviricetes sp.]
MLPQTTRPQTQPGRTQQQSTASPRATNCYADQPPATKATQRPQLGT